MKILIVDDSLAMQAIVRRGLEKFGYRTLDIRQASGALEALEIIDSWQPEIVLSDWHMPEVSGLELLQEITTRELPIQTAFVTTVNDEKLIAQAVDCGACFVLSKPFEDAQLHKAILPLVQGATESERLLNTETDTSSASSDLVLPKLSQLEKVLHRFLSDTISLKEAPIQHFSIEDKIPTVLALFEDVETQKIRALAILDIYAACVLGGTKSKMPKAKIMKMIKEKVMTKSMIDSCEQVMSDCAFAFLDKKTRKNLRLKSVSFTAKSFPKLEILFKKPPSQRTDIQCEVDGFTPSFITVLSS
ncbi:response regulator [Pseudoalteromonas denitrificans]|uniref:CheY chemotaxis protein or a CheY-like REC (Receiver) domain n=1 Tax=Pseudoalteromonas denitrificans DSM 6059 TaxID=1123010 RepID=A0A1I1T4W7_9GAMM|nr:response regulator [Pseudoalteromonas denitrificans]SFD53629.1 CheY chemotaxis protein or a CheY-like REC (receiver) domain [Pseudoalteromonas denitrificans DSM 6059]